MSNIPITPGSGAASVAAETIGGLSYQQIEVQGPGGANTLIVNSDGTLNARISGSVLSAGGTFTGSVSGTVGASIIGVVPVQLSNSSVITVWQNSSIIAVPTGNQSVSGTVGASILGSIPVQFSNASVIVAVQGSIATVIIGGSIATSFTPPVNQSVSGTVGASVLGLTPVNVTNFGSSIYGTVSVMGTVSVLGTVPVTQVTSPWIITGSVQGSFSPSGNQSVSGTVGASVIGWIPIQPSNTSFIGVNQGSIAAVIIGGSIAASFTPAANQSVSGTVGASIIGLAPVSVSNFPTNQNVSGSVVGFQGTNPWIVSSSIAGGIFPISGSVAALILGQPIGVTPNFSSILAVPVGSVITVLQAPSIVGTYAEDAASASGDKGILGLNVRNDTLSSVTSADGDYGAMALGPAGEVITANAPLTKWIQGTGDFRPTLGAQSVFIIAAQGSSVFTYVTGVQVANFGPSSVLVTLLGGIGSVMGYTIAPAGGGSNIVYPNALKTAANQAVSASISGTASVLVSAQGFIAKI